MALGPAMDDALSIHRLHFAFTITFHYLFPLLTMGLSALMVIFKVLALRREDPIYAECARFWARIFAINFAIGVVTGIPMEFQFGTNWASFSRSAGGVIGQTLAMEGVFAFFLESTCLGLFLFGEQRLGPRGHLASAVLLFLGSWLSGYFIVCTNAWMQHPVGYHLGPGGEIILDSVAALLLNPWAWIQYLHTMNGALIVGCFVVAAVGAFYQLSGRCPGHAQRFLRVGVSVGAISCALQIMPSGDLKGKMLAHHQPVTLAAMEGLFETEEGAGMVLLGQPNMQSLHLDNPIVVPKVLSFLTYNRWKAEVRGLDDFPREEWPDNVPLLYYSYHIMVGLGTLFVAVMALAAWLLWRGTLFENRRALWLLMLSLPFPYIANIAGWMSSELGRQPWIIYGLMRTSEGASPRVSAGNGLFSLLGFMGLYTLLSFLFVSLVIRELAHGPEGGGHGESSPQPEGATQQEES